MSWFMTFRDSRLWLALLLLGVLGVWWLAPAPTDWMLPCPLHRLTGLRCPLCGGQRMAVCLLQGRWADAFWQNPFLWLVLPWLASAALHRLFPAWCRRHSRLSGHWLLTPRALLLLLGLVLCWGIVRNVLGV